jgi:hypothetical protein
VKFTIVASLIVAAAVAAAGCGGGDGAGSGDKTFEGDGYSFTYPGEWDEQEPEAREEGGDTISSAYVGEDNTDVLGVFLYRLRVSITKNNLNVYADDITNQMKETYEHLDGRLIAGPSRVTMDGLPGFRYLGSLVNVDGVRVQARVTRVFDGMTEYYLYCQFTSERAEAMKRGCDQVVESFQVG